MLEHFSSFCSTGRDTFLTDECPVNLCTISFTDSDADLVIFKEDFANRFTMPSFQRPLNQLWMIYMLENPLHTHIFGVRDGLLMKTLIGMSMCKKTLQLQSKNVFNWTATYRSDSTTTTPYGRWQYYNEEICQAEQSTSYADNKTKAVAWFVSNCATKNGRLQYARELGKYIQVHTCFKNANQ